MTKRPFWSRMNCCVILLRWAGSRFQINRMSPSMQRSKCFKKLDDLLGLNCLLEDLKVEVPDGDTGDDRERFPVEVKLEDRCLPARRPGAPPMRPLAQTAFVYEDDGAAFFLGFFLI